MPNRYVWGLIVLVALTALWPAWSQAQAPAASPVSGSEEQARAHFRLGRAHYDNGSFAQAAVEFEEAYRISQRAALLYNIYLAYRDANDTHNAAEALRKYLALEKEIENRGQLEAKLAALDRAIAAEPPSAAQGPNPSPSPLQPAPLAPSPAETAASASPPEAAPTLAGTDHASASSALPVLPIVLMGTGGAMMIASIVTGLRATSAHSDLSDARDQCEAAKDCTALSSERVSELNDLKSSGQTLALLTDILLFGGIAVAGTGGVLFFLNLRGDEAAPAAISCGTTGCIGRWKGRF